MAATESDLAAKLLERLLSDPAFRAQFRRDPAGACREAGLDCARAGDVRGRRQGDDDARHPRVEVLAGGRDDGRRHGGRRDLPVHRERPPAPRGDPGADRRRALAGRPAARSRTSSRSRSPAAARSRRRPSRPAATARWAARARPVRARAPPARGSGRAAPGGAARGARDARGRRRGEGGGGEGARQGGRRQGRGAARRQGRGGRGKDAAAGGGKDAEPDNSAAQEAAKKIAKENSPEAAEKAKEDEAAAALDEQTDGRPGVLRPADRRHDAADRRPDRPRRRRPRAAGRRAAGDPAGRRRRPTPRRRRRAAPTRRRPPRPAAGAPGRQADGRRRAGRRRPRPAAATRSCRRPRPRVSDAVVPPPEAGAGGKGKAKSAAARLADALTGRRGKGADAASREGRRGGRQRRGAGKGAAAAPSDAAAPPGGHVAADTRGHDLARRRAAPADTTLPTAGTPPAGRRHAARRGARPPTRRCRRPTPDVAEAVVYAAGKPEALALLKNKNVVLDAAANKELKAGHVDPRVVAVLTKLSAEHKLTVTRFQDGVDIGAIDGEPVSPDSPLAREVASELSQLKKDYRPDEIGSPFQIRGAGYFTDAAHQTSIHVGFKDDLPEDWKPPTDVAAEAEPRRGRPDDARGRAAARGGAGRRRAGRPRRPRRRRPRARRRGGRRRAEAQASTRQSQLFLKAVTRQGGGEGVQGVAAATRRSMFQKVVEPPKPRRRSLAQAAAADPAALAQAIAAPGAYPGDNAPREQIAAWMASEAQRRGLPPELPLMASLVESGMKNLNFGDADSVGFFQMRVGIWNNGPYAGYPEKPELQVKWFLDNAEAVKKQRGRGGQVDRRPEPVRRLDRRRRAPGRAVPRPLPDQAGRGPGAAQEPPGRPAPAAAVPAAVDAAAVAPAGGGGSSLGAAALQIAHSQKRRAGDRRRESRPAGRGVPRRGQGRAGEPVVRLVHHVVAGEGRAQDAGRRLGRRPDLGAQRRAGQQRPEDRQRRGRAARRHRRLRLGRPGRLRLRRPHRVPGQHRPGRQVQGARGQQRRRGDQHRSPDGQREHQVHPDRGQRTGAAVPSPAGQRRGAGRRARRPRPRRVGRAPDRPDAVRRRGHRRHRRAPRRSRC